MNKYTNNVDIVRLARGKSIVHYNPKASRAYRFWRAFFAWFFFGAVVVFNAAAYLGVIHV